ncbi:hypothetical protein [Bailinhaonella thermotolerans]|uniref:Uncharacterized protein n=1 Tax=Bailinhaonella thermotolerans TaxID=1070861 RepID=A0A3A4A2V5_9ACTN|nr:hypothetical protein [Bailinhaonella thermotolerans]RJL21040.1 hypothetical protein D5H75_38145 [Bailinhaonella thermotolerans]
MPVYHLDPLTGGIKVHAPGQRARTLKWGLCGERTRRVVDLLNESADHGAQHGLAADGLPWMTYEASGDQVRARVGGGAPDVIAQNLELWLAVSLAHELTRAYAAAAAAAATSSEWSLP